MKRHKALIPLSHYHHQILVLAQVLKRNNPPYKNFPADAEGKTKLLFENYYENMLDHFRIEEVILFPMVKGYDKLIDDLCDELASEHQIILSMLMSLKEKNEQEEKLDKLGQLLDDHIRKEERRLFPMIQEKIPEHALVNISVSLQSKRGLITKKC